MYFNSRRGGGGGFDRSKEVLNLYAEVNSKKGCSCIENVELEKEVLNSRAED